MTKKEVTSGWCYKCNKFVTFINDLCMRCGKKTETKE